MTKTTYKVGDVAKVLSTKGASMVCSSVGTIVEIIGKTDEDRYQVSYTANDGDEDVLGYISGINLELVSPKPTKKQRITSLEQKMEAMQSEIDALKTTQKPPVTDIADAIQRYKERTPNQKRKAIIDEAKAFVESKFSDGNDGVGKVVWGDAGHNKVEFVVNAEKRTVVAILRLAYYKTIVTSKGIAKCAPSDVFNADIGKAIALGRALGLDVGKFEKAVQPSEVVVGQVVRKTQGILTDSVGAVTSVGDTAFVSGENGLTFTGDKSLNGDYVWAFKEGVKITDDTEAQY